MSDAPEVIFDAPVEKPKLAKPVKKSKAKKRTVAKVKAEPKSNVPFPGMTRTACADSCNIKGCAISGKDYCAHPCKGALRSSELSDTAALKRIESARAQIGVRIDPDRFK